MRPTLALLLAALLFAAPVSAQIEHLMPGTAPVTSYVSLKDVVGGYAALLQNPLVRKLLEQLHVALPDADQLVSQIGIAGHLHRAPQPASTLVLRGKVEQERILAALRKAGIELTESVYRGVPLYTGVFQEAISVQVGFVGDTCTLMSFDPSTGHPLVKDTIDTIRGTRPSFAQVTGWVPAPHALFSTALKTEAIAPALEAHGLPAGLLKHVQLAWVDALPAVLHLAVDVRTGFRCDSNASAGQLKTWLKRLNVLLVVLPGLLHGSYHSLKITQDGNRVFVNGRLKLL